MPRIYAAEPFSINRTKQARQIPFSSEVNGVVLGSRARRSGEGGEKRENRTRKTGSAIMQLKGSGLGNFFYSTRH